MTGGFAFTGLFLEGLLSFFTPCVLPLVPLYMAYLVQDSVSDNGEGKRSRGRTFLFTIAFVLGICTVFFLAGLTSGVLHDFFTRNDIAFRLTGGILLILMGLVSLNVIQIPFLQRTFGANRRMEGKMTLAKAWLTGFFFSFAWSPCIGPMLAQAILLASSAESKVTGFLYIASYALGFICIFLLLGLFTDEVLRFLKKRRNIVKYTGIISGLVVLGMGAYMTFDGFTRIAAANSVVVPEEEETLKGDTDIEKYGFILQDANNRPVRLASLKGKTVVLNFFGTWCYYCTLELPSLQEVYENDKDVEVLLVAAPGINGEGTVSDVERWMKENGYTMPVVYDNTLEVTNKYQISGYPTTFIFKEDGNFLGYIPGYLEHDALMEVLEKAKTGG